MSDVSIFAMVVDRARIDDAREAARLLEEPTLPGGAQGWTCGLNLFEAVERHQYVLMIADGKFRIVNAAPRVVTAEDLNTLRAAVRIASDNLCGEARWLLFTDTALVATINRIFKEGGCYDTRH